MIEAVSGGGGIARCPFVTLCIADSGDTVAALGGAPVYVNFVGSNHIVVEPAAAGEDDEIEVVSGSPPEEMYAHFANRRSPGSRRRRRGKHGRRGGGGLMEAEHFVRIADAEPTWARPLQGLWKVLPPLYAELAQLSVAECPGSAVPVAKFDCSGITRVECS
ncbi:F-box protein At3g12350-like [Panicum virgatum]|nr:F-box protein At3g12350-like [Panicum virgatum]